MNCRHTTRVYTEWREGTLSLAGRIALKIHLLYCPGCPHFVEQMDETVRLLKDLAPAPAEPPAMLLETLSRKSDG